MMKNRGSFFKQSQENNEAYVRVSTNCFGSSATKYSNICKRVHDRFPELIADQLIRFDAEQKEIHIYLPIPIAHWIVNTGLGLHLRSSASEPVHRGMEDFVVDFRSTHQHTPEFIKTYAEMQSMADVTIIDNPYQEQHETKPRDIFGQSFAHANSLVIGEDHINSSARDFLIDNIATLVKEFNVHYFYHETLTMEYQPELDKYFDPAYDDDIPPKLVSYLSYTEQALFGQTYHKPSEWQGSHIQLLKALKAAGIKRVIAIDSPRFFLANGNNLHERDLFLRCLYVNQNAMKLYNQTPKEATERSIFFVGSAHAVRLELKQQQPYLPTVCYGLGELLASPTLYISNKLHAFTEDPTIKLGVLDCYIAYQNKTIQGMTTSELTKESTSP